MRKTITFSSFVDEFEKAGMKDSFTYDGKRLLFDYLEENEPDYDLDVIELCCEYTEYEVDDLLDELGVNCESDLTEVCIVARDGCFPQGTSRTGASIVTGKQIGRASCRERV